MRKDGPAKLGKTDPNKSKRINIDNLKDKAIGIKEKGHNLRKDKLSGDGLRNGKKNDDGLRKDIPRKLGKTSSNRFKRLNFDVLKGMGTKVKDKRVIIAVIGFIILIAAVGMLSGGNNKTVTNQTNNTTNSTNITTPYHFDNGKISFDYPKGWNVSKETKAPLLVTVEKDENNSLSVVSENLGKTSFAERIVQWRQNIMQGGDITYEGNITMDNVSGYNIESIYKTNNTVFNTRGIVINKNNTAYFLIFIFNKSLLEYKGDMDQVINSFHVK